MTVTSHCLFVPLHESTHSARHLTRPSLREIREKEVHDTSLPQVVFVYML